MGWSERSNADRAIMGATAAVCVGAFLPWASVFGMSVSGIEGDGQVTLALGVIGLAIVFFRRSLGGVLYGVEIVFGGFVTFIALFDMTGFAAFGLYLTLFAGIAWVIAAVVGFGTRTRPAPVVADPPPGPEPAPEPQGGEVVGDEGVVSAPPADQ
jgi:hypothetical protein